MDALADPCPRAEEQSPGRQRETPGTSAAGRSPTARLRATASSDRWQRYGPPDSDPRMTTKAERGSAVPCPANQQRPAPAPSALGIPQIRTCIALEHEAPTFHRHTTRLGQAHVSPWLHRSLMPIKRPARSRNAADRFHPAAGRLVLAQSATEPSMKRSCHMSTHRLPSERRTLVRHDQISLFAHATRENAVLVHVNR